MTRKNFDAIVNAMLLGYNATRLTYEKQFYPKDYTFMPTTITVTRIKNVGYKIETLNWIGHKSYYTPFITKSLDNALIRISQNIQRELELIATWTQESI